MSVYIKNADTQVNTWVGKEFAIGEYHLVQPVSLTAWQNNSTLLTAIGNGDAVVAKDDSGNNDISDVNAGINYLKNLIGDYDADSAQIIRTKAAKKGWTYGIIPIEITTSDLSSVYSELEDGTTRSGITLKLYDNTDTEITLEANEGNAVKTVVDFEPNYDYELIGGKMQQQSLPTTDIRVWAIGVPDLTPAQGGSKEMVGGVNLKYIDPTDKIEADGRAAKYMTYNATYHTNKMRLIFKHNAGVNHDILISFDIFRQ